MTKMSLSDLVFSIFFLAQTGIGLLGNSILLLFYVTVFFSQPHWRKPTDLIITHLTMTNSITLLTNTAPGIVMAFEWEDILDVVGCRIVLYIKRVSRGLSICTTCLLSVFQAITISPSTSCWARLKHRAPNCILPSFLFFWILCLLIDMNTLKIAETIPNATTRVSGVSRKSCPGLFQTNGLHQVAIANVLTLRDAIFVGLMSWASGYMVMVLHRHHKQVQHIHSTSLSPKSSPEDRATQAILLLVTCFVSFYCLNGGFVLMIYVVQDTLNLYDPGIFLGSCFAFLCPLVLISNDPRLRRLLHVFEYSLTIRAGN